MEFCVKVIPYLVNYIDKIQVAANSYLCFPPVSEKGGKEKKKNDVDMSQNLLLYKMNLAAKPSNIDYEFFTYLSCVARLCKLLEEGL